jgi:hypothetical protein
LRQWLRDSWTHRLALYIVVIATLSLIVQVIATVFLAGHL